MTIFLIDLRKFARNYSLVLLIIFVMGITVASANSKEIDERHWSLEDYRSHEKEYGAIVRPWRRHRNLMYALQDALKKEGFSAGTRTTIWKAPFRDALAKWQRREGLPDDGEISPDVIEKLLGGGWP